MKHKAWTRDEIILAMNLYCRLPFGKMHSRNPDIISLAQHIGRSSGAVAMKMVNLASFDPALRDRGIKGLGNAAKLDLEIWNEFSNNWEALSFESQKAFLNISANNSDRLSIPDIEIDVKNTETTRNTRVRLVQGFFRSAVLASYKEECSFCGINLVELLNASHIIPWSQNVERRADPTNGICLCALHDRAFDRGLMGINNNMSIIISPVLKRETKSDLYRPAFIEIEGKQIILPEKFHPDPSAIEFHRKEIFRAN